MRPLQLAVASCKRNWQLLTQITTWLMSIIAAFWLPPPSWASQSTEGTSVHKFALFILTASVGLLIIPVLRWQSARYTIRWVTISLVSIFGCLIAYFTYSNLTNIWTSSYMSKLVVIGSELTPHGEKYLRDHPDDPTEKVIWDHRGEVSDIWTKNSINHRRQSLAAIYILCLPLFAICLISVVQAVACGQHGAQRQ